MIISLLLSSFLNTAQAVPLQITQQGRILDTNGAALTGTHNLTFRIYDSATGGSLLWSEPITVSFNNGYYATVLGADEQNNALDSNTLSLYPLYLELQVDNNTPMATRQAINSAPYAQMAGNAEVAASVDGGVVNATEVQINATQVIDGSGNWVGQPITIDWSNIDPTTIPSYIADGDDNTQLSETQVETYITNGAIDLATNSQVGGSDIVTAGSFNSYLANDIADGDDDTLAGLGCSVGEIAGWDGNAWVCVSDNTLTVSDITMMLANNAVDLNASTTIGGLAIVTSIDDSDTLANLSCVNDGEIARYDLALGEWYCDADYVLDEATVESYITNGAIDLNSNTTIGGNTVVTSATTLNPNWLDINNRPSGLDDGDDDALTNTACTDGQILVYDIATNAWICGTDTDTTLSSSEVQGMIELMSSLALQGSTTIGGEAPLLASNHGNDADAHHSSTSDGLDITPTSVTIQGTSTSLTDGSIDLGANADDALSAAMVQTLTGGGDADSLHTHAATGGGGACYTVWGTTSCGAGHTQIYSGLARASIVTSVSYNKPYSSSGANDSICVEASAVSSALQTSNSSDERVFWANSTTKVLNVTCALCCQ